MTHKLRSVVACLLALSVLFVLDGCGRKEKLTPPHGADYPRQYPRE
jgi:hypothetical protein